MLRALLVAVTLCVWPAGSRAEAQQLEIHYINVGWGGSVLVKGPDGTTVLLEAGDTGKGIGSVVPYLQSIDLRPADGLDYIIAGHQHCDHIGGLDEVIDAGYDVRIRQYFNGSSYSTSCSTGWNSAAAATTAGLPVEMPVGTVIPLGNGAHLIAVASNGSIIDGSVVSVSNENDRSIALLVQYGGFDWLWASDLGGGTIDQACTGRSTSQTDVESSVVMAISPGGAFPLISAGGIDVLHVNHHGSESSTNQNWMNYAQPTLAVISVGDGQGSNWHLPRHDVVENVLMAGVPCITVPPALVLQTEEGAPTGSLTSFAGYSVGNIQIVTDGQAFFTVSADGQVTQGPNEVESAGLPSTFALDDGLPLPDSEPPTTAVIWPASRSTVSAIVAVSAVASDNVGVMGVEFYVDGVLQSTETTVPYSWSWNTTDAADGFHTLATRAFDPSGNSASLRSWT